MSLDVTEGGTLRRVLEVSGDILPLDPSDQQFGSHQLAFESSDSKLSAIEQHPWGGTSTSTHRFFPSCRLPLPSALLKPSPQLPVSSLAFLPVVAGCTVQTLSFVRCKTSKLLNQQENSN